MVAGEQVVLVDVGEKIALADVLRGWAFLEGELGTSEAGAFVSAVSRKQGAWAEMEAQLPDERDRVVAFWTTRAIASEVGVTEERVRQLIKEGRFPNARKVGRRWGIPLSDLVAYMAYPDRRRKDVPKQGELPGVEKLRRIQ